MLPDDERHGTNAGHRAHFTDNTTPCQPCRDAHAAYRRNLWRKKYLRRVDTLMVSTVGITRRVRALQAIGWRLTDIDLALGHGNGRSRGGPNYVHNLTRQEWVHRDTADKVVRAYEQLSAMSGPSERTRLLAARRGWQPPNAWLNIDDPDEIPDPGYQPRTRADDDIDPVVIDRILDGDWRLFATAAERALVRDRWAGTDAELERRTGWNVARDRREFAASEAVAS